MVRGEKFIEPLDIFGVALVVDAVGCVMSPGTVACFIADQIRWSQCSRKLIITTPTLLQTLRNGLSRGGNAWHTESGSLVKFVEIPHAPLRLYVIKGYHHLCPVSIQSDPLCESGALWVVDVGQHFTWCDGVILNMAASLGESSGRRNESSRGSNRNLSWPYHLAFSPPSYRAQWENHVFRERRRVLCVDTTKKTGIFSWRGRFVDNRLT